MNGSTAGGHKPRAEHDPVQGERIQRHAAAIREAEAGALDLLAESQRPLVRAQMRHARRSRISDLAVCVSLPLLAFTAVLWVYWAYGGWPFYAAYESGPAPGPEVVIAARAAVGFLCLWPLIMFLGAALRAAGSVLAERQGHTAIQLVLTPIPAREIAAAKILPHLAPFLWGIVAAAPLYLWAGSSDVFFFNHYASVASPVVLTPLRLLSALGLDRSTLHFAPRGTGIGILMLVSDLTLVWAAAHWGAALAVRSRGTAGVVLGLLWNLSSAALIAVGFWLLSVIPSAAISDLFPGGARGWLGLVAILTQAGLLGLLCWLWPMRSSVRRALAAFTTFDSLVDEEYRPPRRQSLTGWRWWETNWRR